MLEGIYLALILVIVALGIIALIHTVDCSILYNEVRNIKVQILLFSILFVLFIPETIITSILGQFQSIIILNIFGIIITAVYTIERFLALKKAKEKQVNVIDLKSAKKRRMMKQKKMSRIKTT